MKFKEKAPVEPIGLRCDMYSIYKTTNGKMNQINEIEKDCWINFVDPDDKDIKFMTEELAIDRDFIKYSLDDEEMSRVETEDGTTFIIIDVPTTERGEHIENTIRFETLPLSIIVTRDHIVTICGEETSVLKAFIDGVVKQVHANLKTRFILQILYRVATRYLFYLKQIDKISMYVEKQLHRSMKNKELIQLLDLEKSLVFFTTSLRANEITMQKIRRGRFIKLYEDDEDLLEDVLIETNQAIEMANIYSNILSGTMDAFASIISNNLNIVMKVLASLTIIMSIPTIVTSFYGMNIPAGMPGDSHWWIPLGISAVIVAFVTVILARKDML
jgi:magnesium transporter